MRKKKAKECSGAETCHDGLLSNPRVKDLVNSVFLHSHFIVLLSMTMKGQLETNRIHQSIDR